MAGYIHGLSQDVNSYTMFTYENDASGTVGLAWTGTTCIDSVNKHYRSNINEFFHNVALTGSIVAHEIGHNLNMKHDFVNNPSKPRKCQADGSSCSGIGGVMDYYQPEINQWTCCSKCDFKKYFKSNNPFCLQVAGMSAFLPITEIHLVF